MTTRRASVPAWLDLPRLAHVTAAAGWERYGNCYQQGATDRFFRTRGADHADARQACASCPAAYACLAYALSRTQSVDKGWWGNTSERQRRAIRRALRQRAQDAAA